MWRGARLVIATLGVATMIRAFLFGIYTIPSQSMMPRLLVGDVIVATKWDYGYNRYSFSSHVPLLRGKVLGHEPEVGDVAIFAGPFDPSQTYIKRVMGLPGDVVMMRGGVFYRNGRELRQTGRDDWVIPLGPNVTCLFIPGLIDLRALTAAARPGCRFYQAVEHLPSGRTHRVLDFAVAHTDTYGPVTVPPGHLFMMGDNRDDSADSRVARDLGGLEMVPRDRLIGRARRVIFSSDGTASRLLPWTWVSAFRGSQVGPIN